MEKCVDSEYPEIQYDSSKSSETWTTLLTNNSSDCQKIENDEDTKVSGARKKIAGENGSVGGTDPGKANFKKDKSVNEERKRVRKLNVLKGRLMSARCSVQNNTKTLHRNVPDRLGKYVNSNVRPETKLSGLSSIANLSNDCSAENDAKSEEHSDLLKECSETKLITAKNECLNNEESATLGNSIESNSGTKNIFEKIFDDCLGSTSVVNDASSQEMLNLETDDESVAINPKTVEKYTLLLENLENFKKDDARMTENEKTPVKNDRIQSSPSTPVKVKDHNSYYSHKKIRHVCGYCHKIFKSNGKLNSHVYSHTGERPFDCNNCGKAFSSKFKLVRHLLIHSEIRKFVCQICDRTFLRNDHLKNHYKIHDPQKKMYKCPKEHCDKEYSSVMSHKKHMAYHNVEDGDLKCLICNVKFETKDEILFHLKSHSGSRLFKSQSDKKFKCDFCDRLFLTRKDVTRHLVVHTGERDFLCQFCPQRFGRKDHLVRHIKKSHLNDGMAVKREMDDKKGTKPKRKAPLPTASSSSRSRPEEEEEEAGDEETDQKTHIVITVKSPMQKKKWKSDSSSKSKPFRKESSVPNKKQVPSSKNKSSTTQIFLQNIPNILIIPNNSIILLRNQTGSNGKVKKAEGGETNNNNNNSNNNNNNNNNNNSNTSSSNDGTGGTFLPASANQDRFQCPEDFLTKPFQNPIGEDSNTLLDADYNVNYNCNMLQQPQFTANFPYCDNLGNFQTEATPFGQHLDNINFEMVMPNDLSKRSEIGSNLQEASQSEPTCNADLQRKVGIVKPITKTVPDEMDKDLFEEGAENLIINDSILNDFKVDDSIILDNDGGILNNIFGQSGVEATGNEFLRSLLMSENPILSPLPGFSQIFNHNAN